MMKKCFMFIYLIPIVLLSASPFLFGHYLTYIISLCLVFSILALSLNLVLGKTGKLSFVHGAFFGLGAFFVGYLVEFAIFPIALACCMVFSALVALLVGVICIRLTSVYFAMITLATGEVIYFVLQQLISRGGMYGIQVKTLRPIEIFGLNINLASFNCFYFFLLITFFIFTWVLYRIGNSAFGHTMQAAGENVERLNFLGINEKRLQLVNFVVSGVFAGMAGGLYAPLVGYVSPEIVGFVSSAESIIMVIVGGPNVFIGPIIGGFFLVLIREYLNRLTSHWILFLGISIIITIYLLPGGIAGYISGKFKRFWFV